MSLRVITVAVLLLLGCSTRPSAPPPRARPRTDDVAGCDRLHLRAVIEGLGARLRPEEPFIGRVPVALVSTRLERCVVGEPLATCRRRFERPGRVVSVEARTVIRFEMRPIEPSDAFERRLAAHVDGDQRFEVGRRVRVRVIREAAVCVREQATRRVRVARTFGTGGDGLALLETQRDDPLVVLSLREATDRDPSRFSVRCAAQDEMTHLPEIERDGPCAPLRPRARTNVAPGGTDVDG